jgi:hypothetical protein
VATDLSDRSERAFDRGIRLGRERAATVDLLHVVEGGLLGHLKAASFGSERLVGRRSGKRSCDGHGLLALGAGAPSQPLAHCREPEAVAAKQMG